MEQYVKVGGGKILFFPENSFILRKIKLSYLYIKKKKA